MPVHALPENPSLEHLRRSAKALQRAVLRGDADAVALVGEFGRPDRSPISRSDAQLVVARSYGFASWPRLVEYLRLVDRYRWARGRQLRVLGRPRRPASPPRLPELHLRSVRELGTGAGAAAVRAGTPRSIGLRGCRGRKRAGGPGAPRCRPHRGRPPGGPHRWPPLLYLAYARLLPDFHGDPEPVIDAARALIEGGADVNGGFLWHGFPSPFTVLTGVLDGGEQDQPPRPHAIPLARLLLDAGADPNDNQALYNRMFSLVDDHLELLFGYGLGDGPGGVWHRRPAGKIPSPTAMVQEQLRWAAAHDFGHRVRLLLDHGVDADGLGYHPVFGRRTAYELALAAGNREVVRMLGDAGARVSELDEPDRLVEAVLPADTEEVGRRRADQRVVADVLRRAPDLVVRAARTGRVEAVRLALELGADPSTPARDGHRETGLHAAAEHGSLGVAQLLVDAGASLSAQDADYHATPLEWARHCDQREVAACLDPLGDLTAEAKKGHPNRYRTVT